MIEEKGNMPQATSKQEESLQSQMALIKEASKVVSEAKITCHSRAEAVYSITTPEENYYHSAII